MLTYRWMLISSMSVEESLKHWFDPIVSTGVYTVEFSLREDGNTHLKGGLQGIKPFFSLRAIKTDVVDEISLTYKLYSVMLVGLIPSFT